MKQMLKAALVGAVLFAQSQLVGAVTVKDEMGDFTLNQVPQRVVALELSFVDDLAQIGVTPVGVADDNKADRILPQIREKIKDFTSVGTRSQPSLEVISSLKPDLIIADPARHAAIYEELKKIAPTLMLKSRKETFQENLESAQKIGDLLGKSAEMKSRIDGLKQHMADVKKSMPQGLKVVFGTSRETEFNMYGANSYTGGFLAELGFTLPTIADGKPNANVGLEQLAMEQPEWIIVANYREKSIIKDWEKESLFQLIPAAKNKHIFDVDGDLWARARGMSAAEVMLGDIQKNMLKK